MLVVLMVFGPVLKMHILISGCFTQTHQAMLVQFPLHSRNMRMSKKELTANTSDKLNMVSLHPWFSYQPVE